MVFKEINTEGEWVTVEYAATWRYGYDFMLDAAQNVIDSDFRENLQRVAKSRIAGSQDDEIIDSVRENGGKLRSCKELDNECGTLTVSGISSIMECPVQLVFFNQTNVVRLFCLAKQLFEEHGERVFDNYMNSIEINAYCAATRRRVLAEKADQA